MSVLSHVQGVVQYFSEAWNMLDVLSLLLVYATTIWRFFLPAGNTPYLLLSGTLTSVKP